MVKQVQIPQGAKYVPVPKFPNTPNLHTTYRTVLQRMLPAMLNLAMFCCQRHKNLGILFQTTLLTMLDLAKFSRQNPKPLRITLQTTFHTMLNGASFVVKSLKN